MEIFAILADQSLLFTSRDDDEAIAILHQSVSLQWFSIKKIANSRGYCDIPA